MPENRRVRAALVAAALAILVGLFSQDYTVERGDTLRDIAIEHGVSLSDLIKANNLDNPDLIRPGQVLVIPGQGGQPDIVHVVTRGETISRIAATYGTTGRLLADVNGLSNPDLILIGQKITVPGSAANAGQGSNSGVSGTPVATLVRSGNFHIVKRGENVESIAAKYKGVTAADIRNANGIVGNTVYTGSRLFLDGAGYVATGTPGEISYSVKKGDSLGDIAKRHATSVTTLVSANGLSDPNLIRSGQVLKIPGGSSWVCPVAKSSFFNDWGFPRAGGRYHEGNDLFAGWGAEVRAPVSGDVQFIVGNIGGNQFNLHGDDGVRYLGSHMDSFNGKSRHVVAGEIIGYVGASGNAAGSSPHLHFGMYVSGKVVNPYPSLLKFDCQK